MITTLDRVSEIVLEQAVDVDGAIGSADTIQDLGIDSLTFVDILVKIEKAFAIEFSDDELAAVQSIQDIVQLVDEKA